MRADTQWVTDTYDRLVNESPGDEGLQLKEAREAFATTYEDAVRTGALERPDFDLYAEGQAIFGNVIAPLRQGRKAIFRQEMQFLIDALNDQTILGREDPRLAHAFPLGNGRDKTLSEWTVADFRESSTVRRQKIAELTEAAALHEDLVETLTAALRSRGAVKVGDAFTLINLDRDDANVA